MWTSAVPVLLRLTHLERAAEPDGVARAIAVLVKPAHLLVAVEATVSSRSCS